MGESDLTELLLVDTIGLNVRGSILVSAECVGRIGALGGLGLLYLGLLRDLNILDIFSCGFKGSQFPIVTLLRETVGFQGCTPVLRVLYRG